MIGNRRIDIFYFTLVVQYKYHVGNRIENIVEIIPGNCFVFQFFSQHIDTSNKSIYFIQS